VWKRELSTERNGNRPIETEKWGGRRIPGGSFRVRRPVGDFNADVETWRPWGRAAEPRTRGYKGTSTKDVLKGLARMKIGKVGRAVLFLEVCKFGLSSV
jgi:hypothetical protein